LAPSLVDQVTVFLRHFPTSPPSSRVFTFLVGSQSLRVPPFRSQVRPPRKPRPHLASLRLQLLSPPRPGACLQVCHPIGCVLAQWYLPSIKHATGSTIRAAFPYREGPLVPSGLIRRIWLPGLTVHPYPGCTCTTHPDSEAIPGTAGATFNDLSTAPN
jgi:hypothetical protein